MPEASSPLPQAGRPSAAGASVRADELAALRELLFGDELIQLAQIRRRLNDPSLHARDVSSVIAEALLLRSGGDDRLSKALEPLVEDIIKGALRKRPLDFATVLFPLMGPAIRRSISESFRSMLQGLHKTLEMSFSWKGIHWRLEALRAGKAFSEIVLLHTLVYRVEQIFLIHSESGLVLAHLQNEGVEGQDAEMVSAMLTAIRDFTRDCFSSTEKEELDLLYMGEAVIFVERSSLVYLACVVRGTPPPTLRQKLSDTLELIAIEHADSLAKFNGDSAPFAAASRHLEECLITRVVEEETPLPFWVRAVPLVVLLCFAGMFGLWRYMEHVRAQVAAFQYAEMQRGVDALLAKPGIILTEVRKPQQPPWEIFCLRDELAEAPESILREKGFASESYNIHCIPNVSYEAEIVARRVEHAVRPPETVHVSFDAASGVLRLTGTAPMDWILDAHRDLLALPGVKKLDFSGLEDPRAERMYALVKDIESVYVAFPLGKDIPVPEDRKKLLDMVENLARLEKLAGEMRIGVSVTVYGHADMLGQEKRNYEISQERAKTLAAMLYVRGVSIPLTVYGMGAQQADPSKNSPEGDPSARRIELKVHLAQLPRSNPVLMNEKNAPSAELQK